MSGRDRFIPSELATLSVAECWARIERWLARFPKLLERLDGPASPQEIDELEAALGVTLPDDYRASLRIHRGGRTKRSKTGRHDCESPFAEFYLLSPRVVVEQRAWLKAYESFPVSAHARITGAVAQAYHHPGWIPVAQGDEDDAIFYCLDTVPTTPDAAGQIVEMVTNDPDRAAPWSSFRTLLIDKVLRPLDEETLDEEFLEDSGMLRFLPNDG